MSLRELVTGNDACTTDDGAGPSNAFAGLANALLGTSSKQQERLQELPSLGHFPGTADARLGPQSAEEAARYAVEGERPQIPGILHGPGRDADDFMQTGPSMSGAEANIQWLSEFDQHQAEGQHFLQSYRPAMKMPASSPIAPFLHAFFSSSRGHAQFQPLPSPQLALSVEEQCQIRDRSTIMARHIFADGGDAFADEQVGRLLQSLHIDPRALPGQLAAGDWSQIFQGAAVRADGPGVRDAVAQSQSRNGPVPDVDRWADQFASLNILEGHQGHQSMAQDFLAEQAGRSLPQEGNGWAEEFLEAGPSSQWAAEFQAGQQQGRGAGDADGLQQTRALRDTLMSSSDPKLRNSNFLQFISKMSRGEVVLEDNQVKEVPGASAGAQWAEEHAGAAQDAGFEEAWGSTNQRGETGRNAWADEFHSEVHPRNEWADQFGTEMLAEDWATSFQNGAADQGLGSHGDQEYQFRPNNPFLSDPYSFAKGKELFKNGLLSEAVLAVEAEVQREPRNVAAWRLLGTIHAENDDDQQAIAALGKALQAAPGDAEALLSLGVSYTNELDQARALSYMLEWLKGQPGQAALASAQLPKDARERLRAVVGIFQSAARANAGSADVHIALGVLFNLSRDYDSAVGAFRTALQTRTTDYSLWNKLGATLANSGRSGEAIGAYQKALNLKPNYMRAWTNMGISQANIGDYEQSARFYVRALGLNPQASNVWAYLRTSITCAGRTDLIQLVEDENLKELSSVLPL